jgi:predicted nucleic acid-binding protein
VTVVIDASAVIDILLGGDRAERLESQLADEHWVAPELIDAEVLHTLRGFERVGRIDDERAGGAVDDLGDMPIERFGHRELVPIVWELRHNATAYDAMYIALATVLDCPVVTTDRRLAGMPRLGIVVTVVA